MDDARDERRAVEGSIVFWDGHKLVDKRLDVFNVVCNSGKKGGPKGEGKGEGRARTGPRRQRQPCANAEEKN